MSREAVFTIAKYLRISAGDKDKNRVGKEESNSIVNQRNLLSDFINRMPEAEGAEITEFCDDGWSGKNFERPAVRKMLEQVRQGKIQCIVVKDMSRFGRNYLEVGNYISRVFPFMGVRFIAVNDGFDSMRQGDIDSLETSFKTLLYDLYSRDLSRKVRHAKQFKAQRGDFLSPFAPYGYVKAPGNKNKLVIDPEAAEVVRRIFRMAIEGQRPVRIAHTLNGEQVPTPMLYKRAAGCSRTAWQSLHEENFWTANTIVNILRDECYIGKNIYGRQTRDEVGNPHVVSVDRADWIAVDHTHEEIVSYEDFELAQASLREYKERNLGTPGKGRPLYKKVKCGICGHRMKRVNAKQPYYICHSPRYTDAYACTEERVPEGDLLEVVADGLRAQALYAVEAGRIWEERHRRKKCDVALVRKTISVLKETCAGLENGIQELYERFAFGELEKAEYLALKNAELKKKDTAEARLRELEAELSNVNAEGKLENPFVDHFRQYAEVVELTAEIVADVLEEVVVYPDRALDIVWNHRDDLRRLLFEIEGEDNGGNSL